MPYNGISALYGLLAVFSPNCHFLQIQRLFINTMVKIVINYYLGFGNQPKWNTHHERRRNAPRHTAYHHHCRRLVLAFILGMIANKLRISPLVGYLLAGVLAGPFTPGLLLIPNWRRNWRNWA
jgi:CPA2 family monovalent cation:H+ antiporter-2